MEIPLDQLSPDQRRKLFVSSIVPRPIALVTTVDLQGRVNAAPFSFFNAVGNDPPMIALGPGNRPAGGPKDTAANIRATRRFVVNLVSEAIAEPMNACAAAFPADVNELEQVGLTPVDLGTGLPPRIAEAPVSFLCHEHSTIEAEGNRVILAWVRTLYAQPGLIDTDHYHVHTEQMHLIARMHGSGWYARTSDLFQMHRPAPPTPTDM